MTEPAAASNAALPVLSYRSSPDWQNMPEEILCPLCEYNLRGLSEPRCPECGYTFAWIDLLDPQRRVHPYLFEQHPERNSWSFWRTLVGGFAPWTFWTKFKPSQPSNARRLRIYATIVAAAFVLTGPGMVWLPEYVVNRSSTSGFYSTFSYRDQHLDIGIADFSLTYDDTLILSTALVLLWPLATFATLMIYRASMRRAKVQPVHVMRCVIYSADAALAVGLVAAGVVHWSLMRFLYFHVGYDIDTPLLVLAGSVAVWLALFIVRLLFAYRNYLKFAHAAAAVLCTQVILLMVLLLIMLVAFPY
jgi:hypothetical protein